MKTSTAKTRRGRFGITVVTIGGSLLAVGCWPSWIFIIFDFLTPVMDRGKNGGNVNDWVN
jgi:hypothetical protein